MREERINIRKRYVTEECEVEVTALSLSYWEYKQRKNIEGNDYDDDTRGYLVEGFFTNNPVLFIPAYFFDQMFTCIDRWEPWITTPTYQYL